MNKEFKMEPSFDTIEYFDALTEKFGAYQQSISFVKRYISQKNVRNTNTISNLVIMSVIWTAHQFNDYLSENDILVLLGSSQEGACDNIMSLDPELREMKLIELMNTLNEKST